MVGFNKYWWKYYFKYDQDFGELHKEKWAIFLGYTLQLLQIQSMHFVNVASVLLNWQNGEVGKRNCGQKIVDFYKFRLDKLCGLMRIVLGLLYSNY